MCFCTHSAIYLFTKLCCVKLHLQVVGFMWNQIMDRDFDTEWVGPTGLRGYGSYTEEEHLQQIDAYFEFWKMLSDKENFFDHFK
ncbi:hypothetical protein EB796_002698 [Bugula neritina]|uniref:Uncharacterized protein n=1 Tax=Bugula neritina TaxID=10212 RepID=A0A7J7KLQ9_BUGNE|nr:hypothetical protein EB796_002698 [Bugula neritina]